MDFFIVVSLPWSIVNFLIVSDFHGGNSNNLMSIPTLIGTVAVHF